MNSATRYIVYLLLPLAMGRVAYAISPTLDVSLLLTFYVLSGVFIGFIIGQTYEYNKLIMTQRSILYYTVWQPTYLVIYVYDWYSIDLFTAVLALALVLVQLIMTAVYTAHGKVVILSDLEAFLSLMFEED